MSSKWYAIGVIAFLVFMQEPGCSARAIVGNNPGFAGIAERIDAKYGTVAVAAGDSSDAVDSQREVDALDEKAMSKENLAIPHEYMFFEINLAIEKMPGQASLYTDKAAMLISIGAATEAFEVRAQALGVHYAGTPDPTPGDPNATTVAGEAAWNYLNDYVKSLARARSAAGRSGVTLVEEEICKQYRAQPTFRDKAGVEQKLPIPADLKCP